MNIIIFTKWTVYDVKIVEVYRRSVFTEVVRCALSEFTGRGSVTRGGLVLVLVALGRFLFLVLVLFLVTLYRHNRHFINDYGR